MKSSFNESHVSLNFVNQRLHSEGISKDNKPKPIDYVPPLGDDLGYTSLELLLLRSILVYHSIQFVLRNTNHNLKKKDCNIHQ